MNCKVMTVTGNAIIQQDESNSELYIKDSYCCMYNNVTTFSFELTEKSSNLKLKFSAIYSTFGK